MFRFFSIDLFNVCFIDCDGTIKAKKTLAHQTDLLFTFCKKSSKIKENKERQQAAYAAGSFFTISIVGKLL